MNRLLAAKGCLSYQPSPSRNLSTTGQITGMKKTFTVKLKTGAPIF
jgi:hypothetical protein